MSCIPPPYRLPGPYPLSLVLVIPLHFYVVFILLSRLLLRVLFIFHFTFSQPSIESDHCSRIVKSITPLCDQCKLQPSKNDCPDKILSEFLLPLSSDGIELTTTASSFHVAIPVRSFSYPVPRPIPNADRYNTSIFGTNPSVRLFKGYSQ